MFVSIGTWALEGMREETVYHITSPGNVLLSDKLYLKMHPFVMNTTEFGVRVQWQALVNMVINLSVP
jgi:hypothetical protein